MHLVTKYAEFVRCSLCFVVWQDGTPSARADPRMLWKSLTASDGTVHLNRLPGCNDLKTPLHRCALDLIAQSRSQARASCYSLTHNAPANAASNSLERVKLQKMSKAALVLSSQPFLFQTVARSLIAKPTFQYALKPGQHQHLKPSMPQSLTTRNSTMLTRQMGHRLEVVCSVWAHPWQTHLWPHGWMMRSVGQSMQMQHSSSRSPSRSSPPPALRTANSKGAGSLTGSLLCGRTGGL